MNQFQEIVSAFNTFVGEPLLLILLVGTGIYLTVRLGLIQILKLPLALKYLFSKVSEVVVPFISISYVACTVAFLILNASAVPAAFALIIKSAFTPLATSGFMDSTLALALKSGVSRGVFSNESGLGSAPIAATTAAFKTSLTSMPWLGEVIVTIGLIFFAFTTFPNLIGILGLSDVVVAETKDYFDKQKIELSKKKHPKKNPSIIIEE